VPLFSASAVLICRVRREDRHGSLTIASVFWKQVR
jgi:hypothetical protein